MENFKLIISFSAIALMVGCKPWAGTVNNDKPFSENINSVRADDISLGVFDGDNLRKTSFLYLKQGKSKHKSYNPVKDSLIDDEGHLPDAYLASHVNQAHDRCSSLLAAGMNYNLFKEYVLPYKLHSERQENWRQYTTDYFSDILPPKDTTDFKKITRLVVRKLNKTFQFTGQATATAIMTMSDLVRVHAGDCITESALGCFLLRGLGIPTAIDFTCSFGNFNGKIHMWNSVLYSENNFYPFMPAELNVDDYDPFILIADARSEYTTYKRCAKVFRRTFDSVAALPRNLTLKKKLNAYLDDGRFKDVTSYYQPCTSIKLTASKGLISEDKSAIIFVYNAGEWIPAFWSELRSDSSYRFKDMARNLLYMIGNYQGNELVPYTYPFVLLTNGRIKILKPVSDSKTSVVMRSMASPVELQCDTINKITARGKFSSIMHNIATGQITKAPTIGQQYEIYYWENGWKSAGIASGLKDITFSSVKENALLRIVPVGARSAFDRPFFYDKTKRCPVWL